ncbi:enoyl-CoA hydratase EchA19-like [Saccoglossus kowalevskii]|uniref:Probable enoyl-CoA hydratase, mitochondrial-like n=1 Tax=Saccoglossus kowalevskii TaxID=10224 RepID=A0ABM0H1A4_SACKO|nr:PREDICTED: probable enoyl-CoA hydratase, mitochondrial-like [Saccoglossus kowalevskii]
MMNFSGSVLRTLPRFTCRRYIVPGVRMLSEDSKPPEVVTEKRGNVFLIGINRPYAKNAVSIFTGEQLLEAFQEFEKDKSSLVAVFYGVGNCFCSGFDLKFLSKAPTDMRRDIIYAPMGPSKIRISKPIIGAINGYAVAGGLELALVCDLRVMEESAIIGIFCRRFGVPLLDGGTVRLPQLIGLSRALDLILTGRPVTAKEALEFGIANRVVPDGTALEEAIKLANQIASFPQKCMKADRRSAYYSCYDSTSLEDAMRYEHNNGKPIIAKESVAGASKFVSGVGRSGSFDEFKAKL